MTWSATRSDCVSRARVLSVEEGRAQVTLPAVGEDGHQKLNPAFRPPGHLQGGIGRCAGGDVRQDPFHLCQTACHVQGVLIFHGDDLVDDVQIENFADKASAFSCPSLSQSSQGWPAFVQP